MELTVWMGDVHPDAKLVVQVHMQTEPGDRLVNQDALASIDLGDWRVFVLADGAGGHRAGEVAAQHAVSGFIERFRTGPTGTPAHLVDLILQINSDIIRLQQENPSMADMHTTLCALVIHTASSQAVWLHVGDSRVYHFRQTSLLAKTRDHSLLQLLLDQSSSFTRPKPPRNQLYTALGQATSHLEVEVSDVTQVKIGDWFLLCSDGLWEHFTDEEFGLLGTNLWRNGDCCAHIHRLAMDRAKGRADNLSSMLVFVDDRGSSIG